MRTSRPLTVTLGEQQQSVDARLESGRYSSASEILRAALRALDREDAALEEIMRAKIVEALADPRPTVTMEEVFDRLERKQADRALRRGS